MNLPKAIELGKEAEKSLHSHGLPDHADAIKMLIGAGERIVGLRLEGHYVAMPLLPGETED